MTTLTADNIFVLIKQLPPTERTRLDQLLAEAPANQPGAKAPLDKRVPCIPVPDRTREWQWIAEHKDEYAGQWVALAEGRLIAVSFNRPEISAALKAAGVKFPMILRLPSPEDLPFMGI
ncbi:MAG: hypothetical protein ACKV2V_28765 [Blastocatellia bacterium]